jgi:hypothetical protein
VSAFAPQVSSKKNNPPAPKFGLENRSRAARVQFITEAHSAMNPSCSPGPKYPGQTCFDNPALAAPAYTFGESREHIPSMSEKSDGFKQGPKYEFLPGFGDQKQSKNSTQPAYHFSCALREKADRQYVSAGSYLLILGGANLLPLDYPRLQGLSPTTYQSSHQGREHITQKVQLRKVPQL